MNEYGKLLHKAGFEIWFLYAFKTITGSNFKVEDSHRRLIQTYQDIYDLKSIRDIINVPPGSGKTTICIYFVAYAYAMNKDCNFIYTSFSKSLLTMCSKQLKDILEHPFYKSLYGINYSLEEEIEKPQDSFWAEYAEKEKFNTYSSNKITIANGGTIIFNSVGSAITGHSAGKWTDEKKFTGGLICDDINKPIDRLSQKLKLKTHDYYVNTLLTRLRGKWNFVLNIQQRLEMEDLSGFLMKTYGIRDYREYHERSLKFTVLKIPVESETGEINFKTRYQKQDIEELRKSDHTFEAQYQQNPQVMEGALFNQGAFIYYSINQLQELYLKELFITTDFGFTAKKTSDYSVIMCFGITQDKKLYVIDMIRVRKAFTEMLPIVENFYSKYQALNTYSNRATVRCDGIYIESTSYHAYGDSLRSKIPRIIEVSRTEAKAYRILKASHILNNYNLYIPHELLEANDLISECLNFRVDNSHLNDDIIDCIADAVNIRYRKYIVGGNSRIQVIDGKTGESKYQSGYEGYS